MPRIVIALGGNALGNTPDEQLACVQKAAAPILALIEMGHEVIITHGNGPQVGMIHKSFAIANRQEAAMREIGLAEATAMSQGYIGFHLQNAIKREAYFNGIPQKVVTVISQMIVDANDPAFKAPVKPIGAFYTKEEADGMREADPTLCFAEDSGRGWRRVVASPAPIGIVEKTAITGLVQGGFIVIACGGGGIPVAELAPGDYLGLPAVVDKDYSAAKLAELVSADFLFILTAVERVAIRYGTARQEDLAEMTLTQARAYCAGGEFAAGSMLPKVEAAMQFVESGEGRVALICALERASEALRGESGTRIVAD